MSRRDFPRLAAWLLIGACGLGVLPQPAHAQGSFLERLRDSAFGAYEATAGFLTSEEAEPIQSTVGGMSSGMRATLESLKVVQEEQWQALLQEMGQAADLQAPSVRRLAEALDETSDFRVLHGNWLSKWSKGLGYLDHALSGLSVFEAYRNEGLGAAVDEALEWGAGALADKGCLVAATKAAAAGLVASPVGSVIMGGVVGIGCKLIYDKVVDALDDHLRRDGGAGLWERIRELAVDGARTIRDSVTGAGSDAGPPSGAAPATSSEPRAGAPGPTPPIRGGGSTPGSGPFGAPTPQAPPAPSSPSSGSSAPDSTAAAETGDAPERGRGGVPDVPDGESPTRRPAPVPGGPATDEGSPGSPAAGSSGTAGDPQAPVLTCLVVNPREVEAAEPFRIEVTLRERRGRWLPVPAVELVALHEESGEVVILAVHSDLLLEPWSGWTTGEDFTLETPGTWTVSLRLAGAEPEAPPPAEQAEPQVQVVVRAEGERRDPADSSEAQDCDHVGEPGGYRYCSRSCPCSAGFGDCDKASDCLEGLTCVRGAGVNYGWGELIDVCELVEPEREPAAEEPEQDPADEESDGLIDRRTECEIDEFFVTFLARPASLQPFSAAGHAFVVLGRHDEEARRSEATAFGFYPSEGIGVVGPVPGEVKDESLASPYSRRLIVRVDRAAWERTRSIRDQWASRDYRLTQADCVSFAADVAAALGLDVPERDLTTPGTLLPVDFMTRLIQAND